jgi:hypothetical protein
MKRGFCLVVLSSLMLLGMLTCAHGMGFDGPYSGRVIDADTGAPIEGVVVLGVWNTEKTTPGGAVHDFYDARETLTDKNGEFEIPGMGFKILSNVTPMDFLIFKAGYEHIGLYPWASLKEDLILRKKIKWEGKKAIMPLKKMTMEERKKKSPPSRPSIPVEKMQMLTKEINKERSVLGLSPLELGGVR